MEIEILVWFTLFTTFGTLSFSDSVGPVTTGSGLRGHLMRRNRHGHRPAALLAPIRRVKQWPLLFRC